MAETTEEKVRGVVEAVNEIRESVKKYGIESPEYKEMIEKTEVVLAADQKAHGEFTAAQEEQKKKTEELEVRVKEFEARMVEYQAQKKGPSSYKDDEQYKALTQYFQYGEKDMADEMYTILKEANKTMRMDDDTAGGFLTTTEFDNVIIKKITEVSPVRQFARVRKTSKMTLQMPTRDSIPEATYEGEAQAGDDGQSVYGSETLTAWRLTITVPYTKDLLMDAAFDLESEINNDVAEGMAQKEGNKFVLGDNAQEPEGFLVHPEIVSGASTTIGSLTISGDDLLLLTGELKKGYNPMYGFNRQTLAFLRTLKGTNGQYLWQASLAPNVPNTIAGEPYAVFQDMPVYNVANNLSVIYADFRKGYTITDRTGMEIIRDPYAKKRQAIIEVTFHRWNTGGVTLPEAFVALKTKA